MSSKPKLQKSNRREKLAQALRANLKRRKENVRPNASDSQNVEPTADSVSKENMAPRQH
jgi:hypothetical protein